MKRILIFVIVVTIIVVISVLLYFGNSTNENSIETDDAFLEAFEAGLETLPTTPVTSTEVVNQDQPVIIGGTDEEQIQSLVTVDMPDTPNITLGATTIASNYALQLWYDENIGGEALLQLTDSGWQIISQGGGAWTVGTLVEQGLPLNVAEELIEKRPY